MTTANPLTALHPDMQEPVHEFAELLRSLAGDKAHALTLYGAIAAGTFDPARHTARSVLVLAAIDLHVLRRVSEQGLRFGKKRIAAPLIMTPTYIKSSCDTFPLEFLDIQQNHVVVFGDDPFDNLEFADADIRYQCERELKVLAMTLRQGLLAAAGRDKALAEIQFNAVEGLLRIARGLLWLKGHRHAQPGARVVDEIENLVKRKLPGLRGALVSNDPRGWSEFETLYRDVEALGEIIDGW